jgi:hypothetical protein
LDILHERDRFLRPVAEHVVVILAVMRRVGFVHLAETPVLLGMRRPVAVVVERQHVVVRLEPLALAEGDRFESMRADADGDVVLAHDLVGLDDVPGIAFAKPDVGSSAPQVGRCRAQFEMLDQPPLVLPDVAGDHVGQPDHLAAPLLPVVGQAEVPEVVVFQDDRIAAVFFALLERHEDPLFGVVGPRQAVDVVQVAGVHVHADQVAAADQPPERQVADLGNGHPLLLARRALSVQVQRLEPPVLVRIFGIDHDPRRCGDGIHRLGGRVSGLGLAGPRSQAQRRQELELAKQLPAARPLQRGSTPLLVCKT